MRDVKGNMMFWHFTVYYNRRASNRSWRRIGIVLVGTGDEYSCVKERKKLRMLPVSSRTLRLALDAAVSRSTLV